jgi:hypothetical protein
MKELIRCTTATARRVANMKLVIDTLRERGTMHREDVSFLLGFSPSGARKYVRELIADDVLVIDHFLPPLTKSTTATPVYALNTPIVVAAFLERLETMPQTVAQQRAQVDHTSTGPRMQKVQAEDGRQVHMLRDDVEHKPRSARFKIPAHEPLMAAFFGMASE